MALDNSRFTRRATAKAHRLVLITVTAVMDMDIQFQAMLAKGTIHTMGTADFGSLLCISVCELDTSFPCSSVLQSLNNPSYYYHLGKRMYRVRQLGSTAD